MSIFTLRNTALPTAACIALVFSVAAQESFQKTQSFDSAESAQAGGWWELGSRADGQDYGFSPTSNAGGSVGEAGGTFKRNIIRSAYLDTWTGRLTLNDRLQAKGVMIMTDTPSVNAGTVIGYSDSTLVGSQTEANVLGFKKCPKPSRSITEYNRSFHRPLIL